MSKVYKSIFLESSFIPGRNQYSAFRLILGCGSSFPLPHPERGKWVLRAQWLSNSCLELLLVSFNFSCRGKEGSLKQANIKARSESASTLPSLFFSSTQVERCNPQPMHYLSDMPRPTLCLASLSSSHSPCNEWLLGKYLFFFHPGNSWLISVTPLSMTLQFGRLVIVAID